MKRLLSFLLLVLPIAGFPQGEQVNGVRMWPAPDQTRLVFDVSGPVQHSVFSLVSPDRVVIDLEHVTLAGATGQPDPLDKVLKRIRTGERPDGDLRVVLDLKQPVVTKSFLLKPNKNYGHRLVVDLRVAHNVGAPVTRTVVKAPDKMRDVVIAVDAGHGGEDPGAIGATGVREKQVVLAIARQLEALVNAERGMHAVMIRDGDYYVGLRKRIEKAREARADFFISIHADAFHDSRVRGASVYTLSEHGASSEAARWLAESENAADLIGGVSLDDKDDLLASVLLDLSQTASIEASIDVGKTVLNGLKKVGKVHKKEVQQAGFAVLKSPDVPSILVETAFISNRTDEKELLSKTHQRKLATSILAGLREYFAHNAPPGTLLAARQHVIHPGDTLSELAHHYDISMDELRRTNNLNGDRLSVGQVLKIPSS